MTKERNRLRLLGLTEAEYIQLLKLPDNILDVRREFEGVYVLRIPKIINIGRRMK